MPESLSHIKMPDTLLGRLSLIAQTAEAILNDQQDALCITHIARIRDMAMAAHADNLHEEQSIREEEASAWTKRHREWLVSRTK